MGAAPRTSPSALQIATSFVRVYYRVASKLPKRLGEFYGADSHLFHGEHLQASGTEIALVADRLPIAGATAQVGNISVQPTGDGGYVVVVVGTFIKADDKIPFTQTFILAKQVDSHDEHFFCRNDIFTPIVPEVMDVEVKSDTETSPVSDKPQAAHVVPAEVVGTSEIPRDTPVGPPEPLVGVEAVAHAVAPIVEEVSATRAAPPLPDSAVNGSAVAEEVVEPVMERTVDVVVETPVIEEPEPVVAEPEPAVEKAPVEPEETPMPVAAIANGEPEEEVAAPQPPVPAVPVKKTWASVVSPVAHTGSAPGSYTEESAPAPTPVREQTENIPPAGDNEGKTTQVGSNTNKTGPMANGNGHRAVHHRDHGHMNRGNHQRNFGPSAVVQLSVLSATQLQDPRGVANMLRDEFNTYGYKLRNVDVKAQKGIAFVEYETLEGVRAAVAAWANGPRGEGPFAGLPLQVNEKRPMHGGRRPGSMRGGGRGGARGGRRTRPNSTPVG